MLKKLLFCAVALTLTVGMTSCKEVIDELMEMDSDESSKKKKDEDQKSPPQYVLTVHQIVKYPKASSIERRIDSFSNQPMYVNINAYLHSRNIKKIELKPNKRDKEFFDLVLHLDRRGFMQWSMFSVQFKGQNMALVIDGLCYRRFVAKVPAMADEDPDTVNYVVEIEGPIDPVTAKNLQVWSEKNYKHYHKND